MVACKYCSAMGGRKIFPYTKLQTSIQWCVVSSPWKCRFGIHEICSDLSCGQVICPSPWNTSHHLSALHPSLGARERAPGSTSVLNWVELIEKQRACEWSWGQSMAVACVLSRFQSIWIVSQSNPDVSVLKKCVGYRLPILMPGTHCRTWLPEGAGLKLDLIKMEKTTCSDIGTCMVFVWGHKTLEGMDFCDCGSLCNHFVVLHLCGKATISVKKCKGCSRFRGPVAQMEEADRVWWKTKGTNTQWCVMWRMWQLCFGRISEDSPPKASLELSGHKDSTWRNLQKFWNLLRIKAQTEALHTPLANSGTLCSRRGFFRAFYLACIVKSCRTPGPEILVLFVASGLNAWLMLYKACILQSLLGGVQCPHIHVAFEHFPLMVRLFPGWVSLDPDHCSSQHFTTSRHGWCVNSWRVRIWVAGESSSLSWLLLFPTASSKRALLHRGGLKLWPSSPLQFWPVHYSLRPPNMCRRQSQRTKLIWHEVVVLEHGSQKGLDIWNKV